MKFGRYTENMFFRDPTLKVPLEPWVTRKQSMSRKLNIQEEHNMNFDQAQATYSGKSTEN